MRRARSAGPSDRSAEASIPTSSEGALARVGSGAAGVAAGVPVTADLAVSSSGGAVASMWSSPIGLQISAQPWVSSAVASVETRSAVVGILSTEPATRRLSSSDILTALASSPWPPAHELNQVAIA